MRMTPTFQRGVALVIVLWILTLLTLIASSFSQAMRTEINVVANSVARAKLEAAANAGVQRAIMEMVKPPNLPDRWNTYGVPQDWEFNGQTLRVSLLDESGKIDINVGNEALLRGLLRTQGASDEEAAALMDAILDWRDPDTVKRARGAEEGEYADAGLAYKPGNAMFQSVEELRLVLGMTPGLYEKLAPHITIYSRQGGVNSQVASREVLLAVPGATAALVDEFLAQRELARANKSALPVFTPAAGLASFGNGAMTIRAEASSAEGGSFVREAVVLRLPFPKRSFTFLRWREGAAAPLDHTIAPDGTPAHAAPQGSPRIPEKQ